MGVRTKSWMVRLAAAAALAVSLAGSAWAAPAPAEDVLSQARTLAFSGKEHRQEALKLLQQHLVESPGDNDARTFYGTILSWEGQYDEGRKQLEQVLADHPFHSDAMPALINLELWSDHPARAEELARQALTRSPKDTGYLLQLARAERNQGHYKEALDTINELLAVDPTNHDAINMRRGLTISSWKWEAEFTQSTDFLSAGRDAQNEQQVQLRGPTRIGSLIGRVSRAERFGDNSWQLETDLYPHIRPGTYMYFNLGASPDQVLYPKYRVGADIFQMVGHGFEISGGYRRLQFGSQTNIATGAVAKYYGDWLFTFRMFLTPDDLGVSKTVLVSARRFFGSEGLHDYVEVKFSRGSSLALARTTLDIIGLNSTRVTIEADKTIGHFAIDFKGGAGSEDQEFGGKLNRYTVQGSIFYRF